MTSRAELVLRDFGLFAEAFWGVVEPDPLQPNWHMAVVCTALQDVAEGRIQRLAIAIPPRHSKSLLASVLWPAWLHARDPRTKIMSASHSLKLSLGFAKMHREILRSPVFQRAYPWTRIQTGSDAAGECKTTAGGRRISGAVGSRITGHGGSVMLIDDPHDLGDIDSARAREEVASWYRHAWLNRRDSSSAAEVIIMQRSAIDDLIGEVRNFGFRLLSIPAMRTDDPPPTDIPYRDPRRAGEALVPDRLNAEELRVLSREMGRHYAAVYGQDPRAGAAALFRGEWFQEPPAGYHDKVNRRIRLWDKAATRPTPGRDPDWTAGALVANFVNDEGIRQYVIEDIVRMRDTPMRTEQRQLETAKADRERGNLRTYEEQEPGSAGVEAIARRRSAFHRIGCHINADHKTGPKEERWGALSVQAEAGNVYMRRAPWNEAWIAEAEQAPNGRHDDQLDAVSGAFSYASKAIGQVVVG